MIPFKTFFLTADETWGTLFKHLLLSNILRFKKDSEIEFTEFFNFYCIFFDNIDEILYSVPRFLNTHNTGKGRGNI